MTLKAMNPLEVARNEMRVMGEMKGNNLPGGGDG